MPKERIQSAEVMYSAPPQYHVRGAAINLVISNNLSKIPQLQGQINTEYAQYHYASYKAGVTLMYNTPKTATDFMYQFGYLNHRSGLDLDSKHTIDNILYDIEQSNRGYNLTPVHNIRFGNDMYLAEESKLSLVYTGQIKPWGRTVETSTGTFSNSENKKIIGSPVQMHNVSLSYSSPFRLNTGIDYTFYKNYSTQNYSEYLTGKEDMFKAQSKQNINKIALYADQSHSLGKDWTLDYGTKFIYASDKSSQTYSALMDKDLSTSNTDSNLNEYSYELYAGFSKEFSEKFSLKAHLIGEYYKHKNKDYWSAFPELELTYVVNPSNIIQYSISSDKEYPSYWEMINSVSHINGYTELHGNPNLKPYRSYETQLSYILKNKYIFTLYGNYQNDYFVQLPYQSSKRLALIYKTTNFDYSNQIGVNVVIPFYVGHILSSRLALNGFYSKVKSSNFHDLSFTNNNFGLFAILNNTFNISSNPNIKAELSGMYTPKNIQGPATLSRMYKVDTGVKWISNDNKAEIGFKINDIFNSWSPNRVKTQFESQNLNMYMKSDNRYVSLSLTYKFGGFKENKIKEVDTSRFGAK